jgi:hypothetical protein
VGISLSAGLDMLSVEPIKDFLEIPRSIGYPRS